MESWAVGWLHKRSMKQTWKMKNSIRTFNPGIKQTLFWVLNSLFWALLICKEYIAYVHYFPDRQYGILLPSLTFITGFLVTIPIRYLFIYTKSRIPSLTILSLLFLFILIVFSVIWKMADMAVSYSLWEEARRIRFNQLTWMDHFMDTFQYLLYMLVWGAIYFSYFLWNRVVIQTFKTQEAENMATNARYQMLQSQLNPHFLFNSMNSIRALIFENPQKAAELVTELSDVLRYNLQQTDVFSIALDQELSAIENYLSIEKKRFEKDLHYELHSEPSCGKSRIIPNLLLPLVDNAVKYGMLTSLMPLKVMISAGKSGNRLHLEIINTGHWISGQNIGAGKGIMNVTERLASIYPGQFDFIIKKDPGFVKAIIEIPDTDEINVPNHHRG